MVNNCAACNKTIRTNVPSIMCFKCNNYYHLICVNISERRVKESLKSTWVCPECLCSLPKHDNSNTPVRAAAAGVGEPAASRGLSVNEACVSDSPNMHAIQESDISILTSEIKSLRDNIVEMKSHIVSLTDHVKQCFSLIEEHGKKLEDAQSRLSTLEEREKENLLCRIKLTELQRELSIRAQAKLRNEVEISGINELPNESAMHLVCIISRKLGLDLGSSDIDYVTRVGPRSRNTTNNQSTIDSSPSGFPRPLVVRFLRQHDCDAFLKASKGKRNLSCADMDVGGVPRNIYINERLTQANRHLFRSARQCAKTADYKFCWVKYGTVYIRKREGSPAIAIRTTDDLQRHFHTPAEQI